MKGKRCDLLLNRQNLSAKIVNDHFHNQVTVLLHDHYITIEYNTD